MLSLHIIIGMWFQNWSLKLSYTKTSIFHTEKNHVIYTKHTSTCTVSRPRNWHLWFDKFIDVIISSTCFDLYGGRCIVATLGVPPPRSAQDFTGHHPILKPWMRTIDIQSSITTTSCGTHTPFRHLSSFSIQIQSIPAIPFNKSVIVAIVIIIVVLVQISPVIIKNIVTRAWVRAGRCGFLEKSVKRKKRQQRERFLLYK